MPEFRDCLIHINAPHFCCGVILQNGRVVQTAPIVKYMRGWPQEQVLSYCTTKKWQAQEILECPTAS